MPSTYALPPLRRSKCFNPRTALIMLNPKINRKLHFYPIIQINQGANKTQIKIQVKEIHLT